MTTVDVRASDRPWSSFSQSDYTPEQWRRACLIDTGNGDPDSKDRYSLPVREPGGALNRNGVHAAAARLNQVGGIGADKRGAAARALVRLYSELGEEPPDSLRRMAGQQVTGRGAATASGEVECRDAEVRNVNYGSRIVTVVAAPYDEPAMISYRGQMWQEMFARGAWDSLKGRFPHRVRANRGHDKNRTVGKATGFWPDRDEGLVTDIRIARTPLGDETLALADDECLSASVGFGVLPDGQELDHGTRTRRITTAFLDHISFVEDPAYAGATVLGVRQAAPAATPVDEAAARDVLLRALVGLLGSGGQSPSSEQPRRRGRPELERLADDEILRWADKRASGC